MWGVGEGRFTEKVSRRITLRGSCLLESGFMKPSRQEERLGPEQDDRDRLGIGTEASVCVPHPLPVTQCLQEGKLQSEHIQVLYKDKCYHHQVLGPQWSGRSLVLGVEALGEMTEFVPMITFTLPLPTLGSQRAFTITISFGPHNNNGLGRDC